MSFEIWIDGDGCPVKELIFKVAARFELMAYLVTAVPLKVKSPFENLVAGKAFNGADDLIIERMKEGDLVITGDIEVADRALKMNCYALDFKGNEFHENNIGDMMGKRALMATLWDTQFEPTRKGKKRQGKDDSVFSNELNNLIQKILKNK